MMKWGAVGSVQLLGRRAEYCAVTKNRTLMVKMMKSRNGENDVESSSFFYHFRSSDDENDEGDDDNDDEHQSLIIIHFMYFHQWYPHHE